MGIETIILVIGAAALIAIFSAVGKARRAGRAGTPPDSTKKNP